MELRLHYIPHALSCEAYPCTTLLLGACTTACFSCEVFPRRRFLVSPRAFSCNVFPRRRFYFLNDATGDRRLRDSARNCPILIGASEPRTDRRRQTTTPHKNDLKIPGQLVLSRVRVSRTKLRSQGDQNYFASLSLSHLAIWLDRTAERHVGCV